MMYKNGILLIVIWFSLLTSCNRIKGEEFSGEWIVNKATFNNKDILMATQTIKMMVLPNGYNGNQVINFNAKDSTVDFPGIHTKDIPCKWKIVNNKLNLYFDTLRFRANILKQLVTIKTNSFIVKDTKLTRMYNLKRDSILKHDSIGTFKIPMQIYLGIYNIEKTNGALILTSGTTKFELLNMDQIFKRNIDQMFKL